jgi:hypothetical protein
METRKRAKAREIYKGILEKGIEVRGQKPTAVASAALASSSEFDHTRDGYGLKQWSNGGTTPQEPIVE